MAAPCASTAPDAERDARDLADQKEIYRAIIAQGSCPGRDGDDSHTWSLMRNQTVGATPQQSHKWDQGNKEQIPQTWFDESYHVAVSERCRAHDGGGSPSA
jgi:hypothetical protein